MALIQEGKKAPWLASASEKLNNVLGLLDKGDDFRQKWEILQSGAYHPCLRAVRHKDKPQMVHAAISHPDGALCTDDGNQLLYHTCCGITTYERGEGLATEVISSEPAYKNGDIVVMDEPPAFKALGDAADWTGYFVGVRGDTGGRYVEELAFTCPDCLKHPVVQEYEGIIAETQEDVKPLLELQEALA